MTTSLTGSLATTGSQAVMPSGQETVKVRGKVEGLATMSIGYKVLLCKIPDQATIIDGWVRAAWGVDGVADAGAAEINVGFTSDPDALIASASASLTLHTFPGSGHGDGLVAGAATANLELVKLSMTTSNSRGWDFLEFAIASGIASATSSGNVYFMVEYSVP